MKRFHLFLVCGVMAVFLGALGWWLLPRPSKPPTVTFVRYVMAEDGLWAVFRMRNESLKTFGFEGNHDTDPCHFYRSDLNSEWVEKWEGWCGTGKYHLLRGGREVEFPVRPLDRRAFHVDMEFWLEPTVPYGTDTTGLPERVRLWLREKLNLTTREKFMVQSEMAPPPPTVLTHPDLFAIRSGADEAGPYGHEPTTRTVRWSPSWDVTLGIKSLVLNATGE